VVRLHFTFSAKKSITVPEHLPAHGQYLLADWRVVERLEGDVLDARQRVWQYRWRQGYSPAPSAVDSRVESSSSPSSAACTSNASPRRPSLDSDSGSPCREAVGLLYSGPQNLLSAPLPPVFFQPYSLFSNTTPSFWSQSPDVGLF